MKDMLRLAAAVWLSLAIAPANAQYPTKSVHLVSPVSAGSAADVLARILGQGLARRLGQPVVVENKPGADGAIAAHYVATSPADGYRMLFGGGSMFALPLVMRPAPFNAEDLAAVSTVGRPTYGLYVHPDVPGASLKEFVAYAKANPGKLHYGSVNLSTELAATHLIKSAGVEITKVPYKGGGQAIADLMAGRVQIFFGPIANGLKQAQDGRLRLLAVHPARSSLSLQTPTMADAGVPIVFEPMHYLILVPAKTPKSVIEQLSQMINETLADPEIRSQLERQGLAVEGSDSRRAASVVQDAIHAWREFVREAGMAPN